MLYKAVLTVASVGEILKYGHSNESYWELLSCDMLYNMVLIFEFVDVILKYDNSNLSYWAVLSCCNVKYAVQHDFNFWVCGCNPKVLPFKWKLLSSTFLWCCLFFSSLFLLFLPSLELALESKSVKGSFTEHQKLIRTAFRRKYSVSNQY